MWILTWFIENREPVTGLTPKVSIWRVSDNTLIVDNQDMSEIGGGFYKYNFSNYNNQQVYAVRCDGGSGLSNRYNFGQCSFVDHTYQLDSMEEQITFVFDVEGGTWELKAPNVLTFYRENTSTVIATFLCYDENGNPTIENITKCVRA